MLSLPGNFRNVLALGPHTLHTFPTCSLGMGHYRGRDGKGSGQSLPSLTLSKHFQVATLSKSYSRKLISHLPYFQICHVLVIFSIRTLPFLTQQLVMLWIDSYKYETAPKGIGFYAFRCVFPNGFLNDFYSFTGPPILSSSWNL